MHNQPLNLKNQETKKDRNKKRYFNLLSDKDVHATKAYRECSKNAFKFR